MCKAFRLIRELIRQWRESRAVAVGNDEEWEHA